MRLTSAAEAMGCGSSCLGDMEAAQEAGGKIPGLTSRVRECRQPGGRGAGSQGEGEQAARGEGSILAEVGPCLLLLGKVPSAGQHRERASCDRGLALFAEP